jgi:hypothetical protein
MRDKQTLHFRRTPKGLNIPSLFRIFPVRRSSMNDHQRSLRSRIDRQSPFKYYVARDSTDVATVVGVLAFIASKFQVLISAAVSSAVLL